MYQTSQQTSALCSVCRSCGNCGEGITNSRLEIITSSSFSYNGGSGGSFTSSHTLIYSNQKNTFSYAAALSVGSRYAGISLPLDRPYLQNHLSAKIHSISDDYEKSTGTFYAPGDVAKNNSIAYYLFKIKPEYDFSPAIFLKPGKGGKFVGKADEVKEFVEEAFMKMFDNNFPDDIKISVLEEKQFRKLTANQSTIGLSINRRKLGLLSEIFVLNGSLGQVMLTIGHELGHVLTETLENPPDEEAKAYAFSLMWMKVIQEKNIANLREAIVLNNPAENGLHNVAFNFVEKLVKSGKALGEVYLGLIKNTININIEPF